MVNNEDNKDNEKIDVTDPKSNENGNDKENIHENETVLKEDDNNISDNEVEDNKDNEKTDVTDPKSNENEKDKETSK